MTMKKRAPSNTTPMTTRSAALPSRVPVPLARYPRWWNFNPAVDQIDAPEVLYDAFEELARRVRGIGGLLSGPTLDGDDAAAMGSILFDLGGEAQALLKLARKAKR